MEQSEKRGRVGIARFPRPSESAESGLQDQPVRPLSRWAQTTFDRGAAETHRSLLRHLADRLCLRVQDSQDILKGRLYSSAGFLV